MPTYLRHPGLCKIADTELKLNKGSSCRLVYLNKPQSTINQIVM